MTSESPGDGPPGVLSPERCRILLYHDGVSYIAVVVEAPHCRGTGRSYADALRNAEQAIVRLQATASGPTATAQLVSPRRPPMRRAFSRAKAMLIEKYGLLSNRELAERVGIVGRDAPSKLANAMSGNGTRAERCAIAIALDTPPSVLWPHHSARVATHDDAIYQGMRAGTYVARAEEGDGGLDE